MPTISDITYEERVYNLIQEVFSLNSVQYDFLDYSVTAIEQNIIDPIFNSIMKLAPINTNLQLPNLELNFNRKSLEEVKALANLKIKQATRTTTVYQLLGEINEQLKPFNLTIEESDVYNTFTASPVTGDTITKNFIVLHSSVESFFYNSSATVEIDFFNHELRVSVKVTLEDKAP
jgi:hypothetical protein